MEMTRRGFVSGAMAAYAAGATAAPKIEGFNETAPIQGGNGWQPFSDKKVRVGIAGYGVCHFGAFFEFQHHPNVEVVAATDLFPDRCAKLAEIVGAKRTYPSCEEMIDKEKELDAVFIATDAPSHADLVIRALNRGLHAASAVPALFGESQLEKAGEMIEAVKKSGKVYAMFETTAFRASCYAMRKIYEAGGFGELIYSEGEYFHHSVDQIDSYKGWRKGLPPQWYPTHSNGFYTCVTHKRFTEVTCIGKPSILPKYNNGDNAYGNPYGSEIALFKTEEGGAARMAVAWDTPGVGGETGRVYGQKGCFTVRYYGQVDITGWPIDRPPLPPGIVDPGHHGGSHSYLMDDFIRAILLNQKPCVDIITALNTTVSGIYAHRSAVKGGETLKIPAFTL